MKICKLPTYILGTNAPKFRPGIIWQRSVSPIQMDGSYGTDIRFSEEGLFYRKISFYICSDLILSLEKKSKGAACKIRGLGNRSTKPSSVSMETGFKPKLVLIMKAVLLCVYVELLVCLIILPYSLTIDFTNATGCIFVV